MKKKPKLSYPPDLIVLLQNLVDFGKVQTFEAAQFYRVILKAPILGLKRYDFVDLFQKLRDRDTITRCKKGRSDR